MTRKLDAEDFTQITDIKSRYVEVTNKIAKYAIDEELLTEQLATIKAEKQSAMSQFKTLQLKEQQLVETFREKYGEGEINTEEGTFTPYDEAE